MGIKMSRDYKSFCIVGGFLLASMLAIQAGCSSRTSESARLPIGWVDSPTQGAALVGDLEIKGWATENSGVARVCVYVDRTRATCTEDINMPRPDVSAAWPSINGSDKSGWQLRLDTAGLTAGKHEIVVQATSKAGATRDIGSVEIVVNK